MSLTWLSGEVLTAAKMNAREPLAPVRKAADESLTSSIALQDDDELVVALAAGRSYRIEAHLLVSGNTAGDVTIAWTTTGSIALLGNRTCLGPATTPTAGTTSADTTMRAARATTLGTSVNYGANSSAGYIRETFEVSCTVAGNLQLRWAQVVSNPAATIMSAGSWINITPID